MVDASSAPPRLGIIVIGRNEGERLKLCLHSVVNAGPVVYVDSGSTDGSQDFARGLGVEVVDLQVPPNFTAARARNVGLAALRGRYPALEFAQTIDGDCVLDHDWLGIALATIEADPQRAAVIGRLRERFPAKSVYNALCDHEWDGPPGEAPGFGGIALLRVAALVQVGGYRDDMIAGEDTETAMRMREAGWRIWRVEADMALHDANIVRFGQWWRRAKRGGHGFAEMAYLHPQARWPNWPRACRSIAAWGGVGPLTFILLLLLAALTRSGWPLAAALAIAAAYPLQALRIGLAKVHQGLPLRDALSFGLLLTIGKIPEMFGLLRFHRNRMARRSSTIIEYKGVNS